MGYNSLNDILSFVRPKLGWLFIGPLLPITLLGILVLFVCLIDAIYRTVPSDRLRIDKILLLMVVNYTIAIIVYCIDNLSSTTCVWYNFFSWDFSTAFFMIILLLLYLIHLNNFVVFTHSSSIRLIDLLAFSLLALMGFFGVIVSYDLIAIFLTFELQALSLYILTAINTKSLKSAEAALKYFIYSTIASCFIIFGLVCLYSATGSTNLLDLRRLLIFFSEIDPCRLELIYGPFALYMLKLSGFCVAIGMFIKLGLVPFHSWLPDVYQGMPLAILAITSTSQKLVLFVFIYKFFYGFLNSVYWEQWSSLFMAVGIVSVIYGSVLAVGQENINRLIAYSSIVHSGFLIIGVSLGTLQSVFAVFVYMFFYFLILSALVSIILNYRSFFLIHDDHNVDNSYQEGFILSIRGLSRLFYFEPLIASCFSILLFSLAGIPPLAGFFGKYFLILALFDRGLYVAGCLIIFVTLISSFYYIRLVKLSMFDGFVSKSQLSKKWYISLLMNYRADNVTNEQFCRPSFLSVSRNINTIDSDDSNVLIMRKSNFGFVCILYSIILVNIGFFFYPSLVYSLFTNLTYAFVYLHLTG